jgi:hypothetical protein
MNNFEIAKLVEEITQPYFSFSYDFYGDVKSCNIPNVEDMDILFFKKNGRNRNLIITKDEENIIVEKVKKLNVGIVEIKNIQSIGRFISIKK